jgi:hypothetical protein
VKKSLFEIYSLIVCLITIICAVVMFGMAAYDCLRIASPELTISGWEYKKYLSNDNYLEHCCKSGDYKGPQLSDEEVTRKRNEGMVIAINEERRSGLQDLIQALIGLVINSAVFLVHWKLAKRARETALV